MKVLNDLREVRNSLLEIQAAPESRAKAGRLNKLKDLDIDRILKLIDDISYLLQRIEQLIKEIKTAIKSVKWYEFWKLAPVIKKILEIINNWENLIKDK